MADDREVTVATYSAAILREIVEGVDGDEQDWLGAALPALAWAANEIERLKEREIDVLAKNALLGESLPGEYEAGYQAGLAAKNHQSVEPSQEATLCARCQAPRHYDVHTKREVGGFHHFVDPERIEDAMARTSFRVEPNADRTERCAYVYEAKGVTCGARRAAHGYELGMIGNHAFVPPNAEAQEEGLVSGKLRECLRCSVPDASTVVVHKAIVSDAADALNAKDLEIEHLQDLAGGRSAKIHQLREEIEEQRREINLKDGEIRKLTAQRDAVLRLCVYWQGVSPSDIRRIYTESP